MKKLIGNKVLVALKTTANDLEGILVEVEEEVIYVQGVKVYVIPRENINYLTTDFIPRADRVSNFDTIKAKSPIIAPSESLLLPPTELKVFLDGQRVTEIPTSLDLNNWSGDIMTLVVTNPDVRHALSGKIQKSIEYRPGEVYINTADPLIIQHEESPETFAIDEPDPTKQFLNPSQMIARLQNIKKGNENGKG